MCRNTDIQELLSLVKNKHLLYLLSSLYLRAIERPRVTIYVTNAQRNRPKELSDPQATASCSLPPVSPPPI